MVQKRKIKCDCGRYMEEQITKIDELDTKAMVCPKCNFTTLTKEQASDFVKLKQLHDIIDTPKKIVKIGNSMGIILPDKLRDFGAKVGTSVKIEALTSQSFKIDFSG